MEEETEGGDAEDFESDALAAAADGNFALAQVFASLAIAAAIREAGDEIADAFDVGDDDDDVGDDE